MHEKSIMKRSHSASTNNVKIALRRLQSNPFANLNRKKDSRALGRQPHRLNSGISWLFAFSFLQTLLLSTHTTRQYGQLPSLYWEVPDTKRYRVEGDNDIHSELSKASEAELEKSLNDTRGIRDWNDIVRETNSNKTSSSTCLIDSLSSESCMERRDGTVCIFPRVIVKQLSSDNQYARELQMHHELSDTRYFPQLYEFGTEEEKCRTLFIENVGDNQHHPNVWSANHTYYSSFIDNAFDIFEEKRIIPFDLNICCNIIVNGSEIRIFDFGEYQFESKNETRRHKTEKIRLGLLEGLTNEIQRYQNKIRLSKRR